MTSLCRTRLPPGLRARRGTILRRSTEGNAAGCDEKVESPWMTPPESRIIPLNQPEAQPLRLRVTTGLALRRPAASLRPSVESPIAPGPASNGPARPYRSDSASALPRTTRSLHADRRGLPEAHPGWFEYLRLRAAAGPLPESAAEPVRNGVA